MYKRRKQTRTVTPIGCERYEKGTTAALIVGTVSALIMGFGISCCMVWSEKLFAVGIVVGLIGMFGIGISYPLYAHITKKERERLAPEILRMTEELIK